MECLLTRFYIRVDDLMLLSSHVKFMKRQLVVTMQKFKLKVLYVEYLEEIGIPPIFLQKEFGEQLPRQYIITTENAE